MAANNSQKNEPSGGGMLGWLASIFGGGGDPEREKKRQLKIIAKEFSKIRFKFYKPKGVLATPTLAKFFYEIYKVSSSASVILQNAEKSTTLKNVCIEFFFSDDQRNLLDRLSEESIRERARTTDTKLLAHEIKDDIVNFNSSLDSQLIQKINHTYTLIHRFLKFISYDYYFVLKKFDSSLVERNFSITPKFEHVNAEYICDDIKDFQEISTLMDRTEDWNSALEVLKTFKSIDIVDRNDFARILNIVTTVNHSDILTLIVKHASQDPYYKPIMDNQVEHITEPYGDKVRQQVDQTIQKILSEKRDAQVEKLTLAVFGTRDVQKSKNYTDKANMIFTKKVPAGYAHTTALNFSKAFLLDYFKKDIRELQELILIRGKWTTNILSQQVSDNYYQILQLSDQIVNFDDGLAEEKDMGSKVKKALGRTMERDNSSIMQLKTVLNEVNERALKLINETALQIISFGKSLKMILDDYDKKDHEILINWKELEGMSETPIKVQISEAYKKIYYFVQLIQIYLKTPAKTPNQATPNDES